MAVVQRAVQDTGENSLVTALSPGATGRWIVRAMRDQLACAVRRGASEQVSREFRGRLFAFAAGNGSSFA